MPLCLKIINLLGIPQQSSGLDSALSLLGLRFDPWWRNLDLASCAAWSNQNRKEKGKENKSSGMGKSHTLQAVFHILKRKILSCRDTCSQGLYNVKFFLL